MTNKIKARLFQIRHAPTFAMILYCIYLVWKISQSTLLAFITDGLPNTIIHFSILALLTISDVYTHRDQYFRRPFDKKLIPVICFFILGCIVWIVSRRVEIIDLVILVWCCRNVDFKKIAITSIGIISIFSLIVVVLSLFGVINDYVWDPGTRNRHGFGFLYCTTLSHLFLTVSLLWIFLRRSALTFVEILGILAIDILIFIFTDAKNSFILVILALVLWFFLKVSKGKFAGKKILSISGAWIFPILAVLSLICFLAFNPSFEFWNIINKALANRLAQTQATLFTYGVLPFGQEIELVGNWLTPEGVMEISTGSFDTNFVDNSYMHILIYMGWVALAAVVFTLFQLGRWAANTNNKYLTLCLCVIALHAVLDTQLIEPVYNTFLFLTPCLLAQEVPLASWQKPLWKPACLKEKNR
ncbi:MAG TPA: hypothetical protein OIM11_07850 [Coriobacteriaceae bacterium]|nr:hypothetical protein [Coriobacteriaceae bacterium]